MDSAAQKSETVLPLTREWIEINVIFGFDDEDESSPSYEGVD